MRIKTNKLLKLLGFFFLLLGLFSFLPSPLIIMAQQATNTNTTYVDDPVGLFTETEASDLTKRLQSYSTKTNSSIIVITTNTTASQSVDQQYAEDYFDEHYDNEQILHDTTLLLIDMKNRYVLIQAYGTHETLIDDDNVEYILDAITPFLSNGNYYEGVSEYAKAVYFYLGKPSYEYGHKPIYFNIFVQIGAALLIGGITVGIMAARSGGIMTTNDHTYLDESNSGVTARRDDYLRTSVTKVRKPQQSSGGSSGGRSSGGGGVSSGGHSHSGGGRSF